ncbi:transporter substrate-binding domain-containing protein, partial [Desulfobacterales bacterium HSG17]|nr:transporter substrate-binding domain-containing protein [Desulfobacterales bacterium HSG17]
NKIGVVLGYSYTKELWDFLKANNIYSEAKTDRLNFLKLEKGKIDYFPAEMGNAKIIINELGINDKVTYLPKKITQKPYYIIFNKKRVTADFVNDFSDALKKFKETDEYREIFNRYF